MVSNLISRASLVFLIASLSIPLNFSLNIDTASAVTTTTVASIYLDAPFVQGSYARHHGGVTETFDSDCESGPCGIADDTSISGGTKSSGTLNKFQGGTVFGAINNSETATVGSGGDDPYSINTGFANTNAEGFELNFSTAVKYIGFYWAAGNAGNTVEFYSDSTLIASFNTDNLGNTVGSLPDPYSTSTDSITAINGSSYIKKYYFGSPAGYNTTSPTSAQGPEVLGNEPFAFIHIFAQNNQSFNKLILKGVGFEFDNLTTSTQNVPIRNTLVKLEDATTETVLGQSVWTFKGVTSSDESIESTNWTSDSITATSSNTIQIKQTLTIESGDIDGVGTTVLFRAPLNDTSTINCGTYTSIDTFTATNDGYTEISVVNTGSASRTQLIRGFCYVWTTNPNSIYGAGAVRPTGTESGSVFNSNLDSPVLYIPKLPDVKIPSIIPIIPSNQSVKFPSTKVTQGSGQIQVCLFENDGNTLNGTWGTSASSQNLRFTSNSTTANPYIGSSASNALNLFNNLRISRINNSKFSIDRYVLVRIAPYLGTNFTTNCEGTGSGSSVTYSSNLWPNSQNVYVVRLKAVKLQRTHSFVISPRSGRGN